MPRRTFRTVPDKLLECAEKSAIHFETKGYKVTAEKVEIGFPYTPTLFCKRQSIAMIVEVFESIDLRKIHEWVAYACSTGKDTRVAVCLPERGIILSDQEEIIRRQGVGLYVVSIDSFDELVIPRDLALNIRLPDLAILSPKLRTLLGSAYDQFDRAQWREGFEDACQAFENEARRYFKDGYKRGRIKLVTTKGPKVLNAKEIKKIDKCPMGPLANLYELIESQNHSDSIIGTTLKRINRDRIGVAHYKSKAWTEKRLRQNVGQHMWAIVAAMKETIKV